MNNGNGRIEFLPYQLESCEQINDFNGRALLALDPGLGKTPISLEWTRRDEGRFPALIITPAVVKHHWSWEAHNHFGMHAQICEGETPPQINDGGFTTRISRLTVINQDILQYWAEYLKHQNFRTLIIDECQNFSNLKAKRTKALQSIAKGIPNVLALSATPLTIRPIQLFPVLNILWPNAFPAWRTFAHKFCSPRWTPWGWKYDGASSLDTLHRILLVKGMIRYKKADVLKDLPPKVRRIVPIEPSNPDEYKLSEDDFMAWLKKNHTHRVRTASKAEELTKLGYQLRLCAKLKLKGVVDWANDFLENTDEKLIIFAIHTKALEVLMRRVIAKSVLIDGSVVGRKRQDAVSQFQNDPKTRFLAGQMQAAGVGINLTAATEVGILEFPWRPGDLKQAEDRPHRIGQKSTVFVNYFATIGTIEEEMCKLLEKRQGNIDAILDGGNGTNDLSLHTELLNVLEGRLRL